MVNTDTQKIEELLTRGVQDILPSRDNLRNLLLSGKRLRIYLGIDPTSPMVHIGHISTFRKLRQFQDLGHEIIVLIGDFTALSGDPDKTEARKVLLESDVVENMKTYKDQLSKIIDFNGENPAKFVRNSEWLSKLNFKDVVNLASHFTVQQMLERDNFQKRLEAQTPIRLHEFLYPLMQGYDSVELEVNIEIGGNDQLFNMMFGRTLLKDLKNKEKFVITGKLITDSSGKKIGKTTGNAWNLNLNAQDVYGKIMASPDSAIIQCFEQLTDISMSEIDTKRNQLNNGQNPISLKKELALKIISMYFSPTEAIAAQKYFENTFQEKSIIELETINISKSFDFTSMVIELGFVESKNKLKSLIEQGAVEIDGIKLSSIPSSLNQNFILKVGKKNIVKIHIND